MRSVPLVKIFRGSYVESVHWGRFVLLRDGALTVKGGDSSSLTFLRSCSKPIQALIGITSGALARFGLCDRHIAVASGSHSADDEHIETVREILRAVGLSERDLWCGGHLSSSVDIADRQRRRTSMPGPIESNCSGKHAMMLASSVALGMSDTDYLDPQHPVQLEILSHLASLANVQSASIVVETDGCGAPTFALPMLDFARAFDSLGSVSDEKLGEAGVQVIAAMVAWPSLVAGEGRLDTELMRVTTGRVVSKTGAEGVHVCSIPSQRVVLVTKVDDGDERAMGNFVISMLGEQRLLTEPEVIQLRRSFPLELRNHAGLIVGRAEPQQGWR